MFFVTKQPADPLFLFPEEGGEAMRSFEELYEEYGNSIAVQKRVIENYRKHLAAARKKSDFKEIKRLNSILFVLYEEKSELEERAGEIHRYIS